MSIAAYETLRAPGEAAIVAVVRACRIPSREVDDLAAECRLSILERADAVLASFNSATKPEAFLFSVCRNCWIDMCRARNGRQRSAQGLDTVREYAPRDRLQRQSTPGPDPEGLLLIKERGCVVAQLEEALRAGLATIDRFDADIIVRKYWRRQSAQEIAAALGMKRSRVYDRLAAAKARLQAAIISSGCDGSMVRAAFRDPGANNWEHAMD